MEGTFYRTMGLPLDTWRLIDSARSERICSEVLGKYPTDSQVLAWLMKLGMARLEKLDSEVERITAKSQEALR